MCDFFVETSVGSANGSHLADILCLGWMSWWINTYTSTYHVLVVS